MLSQMEVAARLSEDALPTQTDTSAIPTSLRAGLINAYAEQDTIQTLLSGLLPLDAVYCRLSLLAQKNNPESRKRSDAEETSSALHSAAADADEAAASVIALPTSKQAATDMITAEHETHIPTPPRKKETSGTPIELADLFENKTDDDTLEKSTTEENTLTPIHNIWLEGDAGIGKSTLCQRIVWLWAQGKLWNHRFDAIFWIPLRNITEQRYPTQEKEYSFFDVLRKECLPSMEKALFNQQMSVLLENPERVLLLLDGYDEVGQWANNPAHPLSGLLNELTTKTRCCMLMTSRPYYTPKNVKFDRQLKNEGFHEPESQHYIRQFLSQLLPADEAEIEKNALWSFLKTNVSLMSLTKAPIMLEIVCSIWHKEKFNATDRITACDLYNRAIHYLLLRYLKYRSPYADSSELTLTFEEISRACQEVLAFLETLAFRLMGKRDLTPLIRGVELKGVLNEIASRYQYDANSLLHNVLNAGLLRSVGEGRREIDKDYYFIHLSFQEFFAARFVIQNWQSSDRDKEEKIRNWITANKYNPRCERSLSFTAGLLMGNPAVLNDYFTHLLSSPRDFLGLSEIKLIMNCLEACVTVSFPLKAELLNVVAERFHYYLDQDWINLQELRRWDRYLSRSRGEGDSALLRAYDFFEYLGRHPNLANALNLVDVLKAIMAEEADSTEVQLKKAGLIYVLGRSDLYHALTIKDEALASAIVEWGDTRHRQRQVRISYDMAGDALVKIIPQMSLPDSMISFILPWLEEKNEIGERLLFRLSKRLPDFTRWANALFLLLDHAKVEVREKAVNVLCKINLTSEQLRRLFHTLFAQIENTSIDKQRKWPAVLKELASPRLLESDALVTFLLPKLNEKNAEIKKLSINLLEVLIPRIKNVEILCDPLLVCLEDKTGSVAKAATDAFGKLSHRLANQSSLAALVYARAAKNPHKKARNTLFDILTPLLSYLPPADLIRFSSDVLPMLKDTDGDTRGIAISLLVQMGKHLVNIDHWFDVILENLKNKSHFIRKSAAFILRELASRLSDPNRLFQAISGFVETDTNRDVRTCLLDTLAQWSKELKNKRGLAGIFLDCLRDKEALVQYEEALVQYKAIDSLVKLSVHVGFSSEFIVPIYQYFRTRYERSSTGQTGGVREFQIAEIRDRFIETMKALIKVSISSSPHDLLIPPLLQVLNDDNPYFSFAAASALIELSSRTHNASLVESLVNLLFDRFRLFLGEELRASRFHRSSLASNSHMVLIKFLTSAHVVNLTGSFERYFTLLSEIDQLNYGRNSIWKDALNALIFSFSPCGLYFLKDHGEFTEVQRNNQVNLKQEPAYILSKDGVYFNDFSGESKYLQCNVAALKNALGIAKKAVKPPHCFYERLSQEQLDIITSYTRHEHFSITNVDSLINPLLAQFGNTPDEAIRQKIFDVLLALIPRVSSPQNDTVLLDHCLAQFKQDDFDIQHLAAQALEKLIEKIPDPSFWFAQLLPLFEYKNLPAPVLSNLLKILSKVSLKVADISSVLPIFISFLKNEEVGLRNQAAMSLAKLGSRLSNQQLALIQESLTTWLQQEEIEEMNLDTVISFSKLNLGISTDLLMDIYLDFTFHKDTETYMQALNPLLALETDIVARKLFEHPGLDNIWFLDVPPFPAVAAQLCKLALERAAEMKPVAELESIEGGSQEEKFLEVIKKFSVRCFDLVFSVSQDKKIFYIYNCTNNGLVLCNVDTEAGQMLLEKLLVVLQGDVDLKPTAFTIPMEIALPVVGPAIVDSLPVPESSPVIVSLAIPVPTYGRDGEGNTPLHLALMGQGLLQDLQALTRAFPVLIANQRYDTPIEIAFKTGNWVACEHLLKTRERFSLAFIEPILAYCESQYRIGYLYQDANLKLLDEWAGFLTHTAIPALREKISPLKHYAHIRGLKGNVDGKELEGWHLAQFLPSRIRILLSLIISIRVGKIIPAELPCERDVALHKLQQELVSELETLRLARDAAIAYRALCNAASDKVVNAHIAHLIKAIFELGEGETLTYSTGYSDPGCSLILMDRDPSQWPTKILMGRMKDLTSSMGVCIRYQDRLFYVNRLNEKCCPIDCSPEKIAEFDAKLQPNHQARDLSYHEIGLIESITRCRVEYTPRGHAIYVNFVKVDSAHLVIRVDNLGSGVVNSRHNSIRKKYYTPAIIAYLPLAHFNEPDFNDQLRAYLLNIWAAQRSSTSTKTSALEKIYNEGAYCQPILRSSVSHWDQPDDLWPGKKTQTVRNCLVRNHNQGLHYRLQLPGTESDSSHSADNQKRLYRWFLAEESERATRKLSDIEAGDVGENYDERNEGEPVDSVVHQPQPRINRPKRSREDSDIDFLRAQRSHLETPFSFFHPYREAEEQWYNDDKMEKLLTHYLEAHTDVDVLTPMLGNNWQGEEGAVNTLQGNLVEFKQQRALSISQGQSPKNKVVIPVNLNNNHWTLLYIIYSSDDVQAPDIYYFDPFGHPPLEALAHAIGNEALYPQTHIMQIGQPVQKDGHSCGPWVIEAAIAAVNGRELDRSLNIVEARRRHQAVVSNLTHGLPESEKPLGSSYATVLPHLSSPAFVGGGAALALERDTLDDERRAIENSQRSISLLELAQRENIERINQKLRNEGLAASCEGLPGPSFKR